MICCARSLDSMAASNFPPCCAALDSVISVSASVTAFDCSGVNCRSPCAPARPAEAATSTAANVNENTPADRRRPAARLFVIVPP
jgi:hypothetical protein